MHALEKESHMRERRPTVPVIVGLALALVAILTLLAVLAASEGPVNWKRAQFVLLIAAGAAFAIGWAGAHLAAWLVADRRRVGILGLLLFVGMGLCPPWVYTFSAPGATTTTKPAGYDLLFDPPEPEWDSPRTGVRIDVSKLAIQWAVLAAFAAVVFCAHIREGER
jgi:hypothetical protein